jgi:hypothetical protein
MQTRPDVSLKIKLDFYNLCTGESAEALEELPRAFRQVVELLNEREMRSVVIKSYLLKKRQIPAEMLANRYAISGRAVRNIKSNLFRGAKEVIGG